MNAIVFYIYAIVVFLVWILVVAHRINQDKDESSLDVLLIGFIAGLMWPIIVVMSLVWGIGLYLSKYIFKEKENKNDK